MWSYSGALSELVHLVVARDLPTVYVSEVRVLLINGADAVLATFPRSLRNAARQALERKGIELVLGSRVPAVENDRIHFSDGRELAVGLVISTAGVRGADLGARLGLPTGRNGRVAVTPRLQLAEHPETFVVGDLAAFVENGQPLPMLSPVAIQEGDRAGRNIAALVMGGTPEPFRYVDRGTMATIGRNAAVAKIGPLRLRGRLAWFAWLFLHLALLTGFRNHLAVFINWAWRRSADPPHDRSAWLGP